MNSLLNKYAFSENAFKQAKENTKVDVDCTKKVKLTSKHKQAAQNAKEKIESTYASVIDKPKNGFVARMKRNK